MRRIIKLMADYQCFPLWKDGGEIGNVNPDDLPLTAEMKAALQAWANVYDRTLNQEYPPDSGFASPAEQEEFEVEGRRLWQALQDQLGSDYKVVYYSNQDSMVHE